MKRLAWMPLVTFAFIGCVDFGYDVPKFEQAPPASVGGGGADEGGDGAGGACTEGAATPSADGPQVRFGTLNVDTPQLRVKSGDVVTWTNGDSMAHSVNAGAPGAETPVSKGGFNSPELSQGGSWAWRFCTKRTAFYFCGKHPQQMNGYRVMVE